MFQFLTSLVVKLISSPKERAVIFVNEFIKTKIKNINLLDEYFLFDVLDYNTDLITSKETNDDKVFLNDIIKYYDDKLSNYSLENFNEIHVFAALRFSLYLCMKKKQFYIHEDGNGAASKSGFVQWRNQTDKVDKRKLAERFGLIDGSCKYIKSAYCNFACQKTHFSGKILNFDLTDKMKELNQESKEKLLELFTQEEYNFNEGASIILTQYYFSDKNIESNLALRAHLYQNIANYVAETDRIYVKPHPADSVKYDDWFHATILDRFMPSELLLNNKKIHFDRALTVESTSIEAMKKICTETLILEQNYCSILKYFDLLQAAIFIYKNLFPRYNFMHFGLYNSDVNRLMNLNGLGASRWYNCNISNRFIVVGDKIWGKNQIKIQLNVDKSDIVILLSQVDWSEEIDYDYNYLEMEVKAGKFFSKAFIITGTAENREKIKNFVINSRLKVTDIKVRVVPRIEARLAELQDVTKSSEAF